MISNLMITCYHMTVKRHAMASMMDSSGKIRISISTDSRLQHSKFKVLLVKYKTLTPTPMHFPILMLVPPQPSFASFCLNENQLKDGGGPQSCYSCGEKKRGRGQRKEMEKVFVASVMIQSYDHEVLPVKTRAQVKLQFAMKGSQKQEQCTQQALHFTGVSLSIDYYNIIL